MTATRTLTLTNSAAREKQVFEPLDPKNVRMYVCGPTVYDRPHIGNARANLVFDVVFRLLRALYGAEHVTYARNITDVDDKINARAREEGVDIRTITERTIVEFHEDLAALNTLPPTVEPRATEHIPQMLAIVGTLVEQGHAYAAEGHVLFDVNSMEAYGSLSGRSLDDMIAGARIEVAPYKKDPMDFVLWKPSGEGEPGWDSPWGYGRPGWHLECSAMSAEHLGETFDIHGGGVDLVFPHHENEIAQSTCAHKGSGYARYWMHNGFLQVEGQKMSKSLGNFLTVGDFLKDWPGEVLRLQILMTHYRQPLNWTAAGAREARTLLGRWIELTDGVTAADTVPEPVMEALCDDLNTAQVIAHLHTLADAARQGDSQAAAGLKASLGLLGFPDLTAEAWRAKSAERLTIDAAQIEQLIAERLAARKAKDFTRADEIRDTLAAKGVQIKDGPEGTTWTADA